MGATEPYFILQGKRWRVQVKVFDFTNSPVPLLQKMVINKEPLVTFAVRALSQTYDKGTPYSRGMKLYFGPSFNKALAAASRCLNGRAVTNDQIPAAFKKYRRPPVISERLITGLLDNSGGFKDCESCWNGPRLCRRIDLTKDDQCRNFNAGGTFIEQ